MVDLQVQAAYRRDDARASSSCGRIVYHKRSCEVPGLVLEGLEGIFEFTLQAITRNTIDNQRTERVKVELKVQKSLMGYMHSSPADHYIAVVGSGILLGNNNPCLAPRCKRIGNNVWTKEIWLPKKSLVAFKFLIVHAATNAAVEIENVPARHVQIGQGPGVVEARFNKAGLIGAYGIQEMRQREEDEVERKLITNKNLQKPSKKSRRYEETAKCQEQNIADRSVSDKGSTGVPENIKSLIDTIPELIKEKCLEEIDKNTIIHEIDSGRAGVKRMAIAIANSSLKRFNINIEDLIQAFEKMGLPLSTPSTPYLQEGYSHHEIWLPNRNADARALKDRKSENNMPEAGLEGKGNEMNITPAGIEEQESNMNILPVNYEEQKKNIDISPASHEEQNNQGHTSTEEKNETLETLRSTTSKAKRKSTSVHFGWLSRKRHSVAALGGVALVSCLGLYALYKSTKK